MMLLSLRRRLALFVCPELVGPLLVPQATWQQKPISPQTEHVIRLGRILLAYTGAPSLIEAAGFERRRMGGGRKPPMSAGYSMANHINSEWLRISNCPPVKVNVRTYERHIEWFAANWPADLEWPAGVARPALQKKDAA